MFNLWIPLKKVVVKFDCFPGKFGISICLLNSNCLFYSMHASGERLGQLTGIAAILRFPMPDLDLSDDHHHQQHETNSEEEEYHNGGLQPNPNRTVDQFDDTDEDQSTTNQRTLNENRAEASAW
jgi:hypothetical protein